MIRPILIPLLPVLAAASCVAATATADDAAGVSAPAAAARFAAPPAPAAPAEAAPFIRSGAIAARAPGASCGPRARMLALARGPRGAARRLGLGLQGGDAVVELFAEEGGAWRILVTDPEGRSCLAAQGAGWIGTAPAPAPAGREG
ncbi:hypothetical protein [Oceanicella actignis]|uniref:hypothetical protein n=1 Tax=Oceanicella actignis TaxID=1189325 RepID=UPI0012518FFA|nr:hypothetical protein [Oceanicella actignis]TYO89188.1 hypothetical protein LY05_01804 [Oceanicella actignis]